MQCYSCQDFGHKNGSKDCKSKDPVCLYCAVNHQSKSCPHKYDRSKHRCANCARSPNPAIRAKADGHTNTSYLCPIVQNEARLLMNRTMGMGKDAKNMNLRQVIVM